MPVPSEYAESTLAAFILDATRGIAPSLGWASQADVQSVIDDTLVSYGVGDIADALDIRKLRILTRYHAWKAAVEQTAGKLRTQVGGQTWERDKLQAQAQAAFNIAKADAQVYLSAEVDEIDVGNDDVRVSYMLPWTNDPYRSAR